MNGEIYEGDFANGDIEGTGTYKWPDGRIYSGQVRYWKWREVNLHHLLPIAQWERSKQHGKAEFTWPDGRVYVGDYKDGRINGNGILTWPDGRKYDGQWRNGLQNGRGKFYSVPGEYREGEKTAACLLSHRRRCNPRSSIYGRSSRQVARRARHRRRCREGRFRRLGEEG